HRSCRFALVSHDATVSAETTGSLANPRRRDGGRTAQAQGGTVILDQLAHAELYRRLGERFAAGFDYLKRDLAQVADGRYEILGDDVFAMVQSYDTKPQEAGRWEAHRRYADIQFMISGRERMGVAPLERMKSQAPYDADKDVEFFTGEGQFVTVEQGSF